MPRVLNFTKAELLELLEQPETTDARSGSLFRERFGVELRPDDRIKRWDVPLIPCEGIPRVEELP